MALPQRSLVLIMMTTATLFLVGRQQRIVEVATTYTRGTSVKYSDTGIYPLFPVTADEDANAESRPPLSDLIGENNDEIKQDVQFLMDFAIVGHPKTATTTTLRWLGANREIQAYPEELHELQMGNPAGHVRVMYNNLTAGSQYKRGYKCPRDIGNKRVLLALNEYWPKTKLIVGLRNPITWLESFYNFRLRHGFSMPPAETLIGKCRPESQAVCTDEAMFHVHLSNLGKTNMTSANELELLSAPRYKKLVGLPRLPNPVFLYEINQLHDENEARSKLYRNDLAKYLGLSDTLDPVIDYPSHTRNKTRVLDICEGKYEALRAELLKHAQAASVWIRDYLLPSPDVTVSSKEYFEELLVKWMTDPCLLDAVE